MAKKKNGAARSRDVASAPIRTALWGCADVRSGRHRGSSLRIVPVTLKEACEFVNKHHRHLCAPRGHKFSIGIRFAGELCGVIIVGRPIARLLDDRFTLEVTRCCTLSKKNAASCLYAAAWRTAKNMGYTKLITYILDTEKGTSLVAAGFAKVCAAGGGTWNRATRPRADLHSKQKKIRFERTDHGKK